MSRSGISLVLLSLALVSGLLAACGEKKVVGPAAVKVNGEVISVAEVEARLQQRDPSATAAQGVPGKLIQSLVDKELLRQAAVKDRLDQDPRIHASLAEANRKILSSAYMHKQMTAISPPSEAEVKAYFDQHPERFANRKAYALQEITIRTSPDTVKEIDAKLGAGTKPDAFERWLEEKKIKYSSRQRMTSSDKMLDDVLQKFSNAKVGDAISLSGNDGQLTIVFVDDVESQPLPLAEALTRVRNIIYSKTLTERTEDQMKKLRDQAKIEYVAPFTENGRTASEEH